MYIPIMRNISSFESALFLACLYCFFSFSRGRRNASPTGMNTPVYDWCCVDPVGDGFPVPRISVCCPGIYSHDTQCFFFRIRPVPCVFVLLFFPFWCKMKNGDI